MQKKKEEEEERMAYKTLIVIKNENYIPFCECIHVAKFNILLMDALQVSQNLLNTCKI